MMFTSILDSTAALTVQNGILCLATALALGMVVAVVYQLCGASSKNFTITLALMPALVQVVIMMVNGNLGAGVAVMGAFSLVRFRSVPGSSKEILLVFFAMAVGLATGMGHLLFAAFFTVILSILMLILCRTSFGEHTADPVEKELKVTIPEDLDYTHIFDDLFEKYASRADLTKVKTTNMGSMFTLTYHIRLKNADQEKELLDEIRCRNGNLTIVCGRVPTVKDEL